MNDSALRPSAVATRLRVRVAHARLDFDLPTAADRARLERLWSELIVSEPAAGGPGSAIQLRFAPPARATPPPFAGAPVHATARLRVHRSAGGFALGCGDAWLDLDLERDRGRGALPASFWRETRFDQREFFLLSSLMLLRRRGLYGVHGNALDGPAGGVVISAPSGSGKTTLSLALRRAGWRLLSDDATLLSVGDREVAAHAFRRGFSVTPRTLEAFPELSGAPLLYRVDGKAVLDLEAADPEGHVRSTGVRALLFPRLAPGSESRFEPLDPVAALLALTRQSAGIFSEPVQAQRQLDGMRTLVTQAAAFRLHLCADVLDAPQRVARRLQETLRRQPPDGPNRR